MSSADPDRFIDGRSIRWGLLLSTLAGSYFYATWRGITMTIGEAGDAVGAIVLGAGRGVAALVASTFGIPVSGIEAAALEVAGWLDLFGPFAFPVGVVVVMVTIELTRRGVTRVV